MAIHGGPSPPVHADFTAADEFLNSPATRAALGVGKREWVACNPEVYQDMAGDWLHKWVGLMLMLVQKCCLAGPWRVSGKVAGDWLHKWVSSVSLPQSVLGSTVATQVC